MSDNDSDHWLVRPATIRLLWIGSSVVLAVLVLLDLAVHHHADFGVEDKFGFAAWYGFATCVCLVLFAKLLGFLFKRPDTYYDD